jgi:hypothetical protein
MPVIAEASDVDIYSIKLRVWRRDLESMDSQEMQQAHDRRAVVLHEILEQVPTARPVDWGDTDDKNRTHEFVDIVVALVFGPAAAPMWAAITPVVTPALQAAGTFLTQQVVPNMATTVATTVVATITEKLLGRLIDRQQSKDGINDVVADLPGGTTLQCSPPEQGATIDVRLRDGRAVKIGPDGQQVGQG